MSQKKRWIAAALCMLLLILPIASEYYVIQNAGHVCTKKDCPICEEIHLTVQMLKDLSSCLAAKTILLFFAILPVVFMALEFVLYLRPKTLITLKVELLN